MTMTMSRRCLAAIVGFAAIVACCDSAFACFFQVLLPHRARCCCCRRQRQCDRGATVGSRQRRSDETNRQSAAVATLERFLAALATEDITSAYELVAPSSKEEGDPIAYRARLDAESFRKELFGVRLEKFEKYELGASRWESTDRFRIWARFGGDNDEAVIVREEGQWYVADPIHIIR